MKSLLRMNLWLTLLATLVLAACGSEEAPAPSGPLQPKADGFYVYGTNTIAAAPTEQKARMAGAVLNPAKSNGQATTAGVYGKFMYIGANSTLQFSEVENGVATVYGAENGGTLSHGSEIGFTDINDDFIHGSLLAKGAPIEIAEEGLYYVLVNTHDNTFRIMNAEPQVFGPASPFGYEAGVPLAIKSTDKNKTVFEGTNIAMKEADGYRYRFNKGYEVYNNNVGDSWEEGEFATLNQLAVEDYGAAWEAGQGNFDITYFDGNMPHHTGGMYTMTLTFDAATGEWSEVKTKTGEIVKDFTNTDIALFGNAFMVDGVEANWDKGLGLHLPVKNGTVYTWSWDNVSLIEGREFIFLEVMAAGEHASAPFGGYLVDFAGATTRQGTAFSNGSIVDATTVGAEYPNYGVVTGGTYDITLTVDAQTATKTVTIEPVVE